MHEAGHSKLELWDYSEGWGGEGGGKWAQNGGHMHLCLIHINVWLKPSQYCKVIILQFKLLINFKKDSDKTQVLHAINKIGCRGYIKKKKKRSIFIYLVGCTRSSWQQVSSLVLAWKFFTVACLIWILS